MERYINTYTTDLIEGYIAKRPGETRLGQHVGSASMGESMNETLSRSNAHFVLTGITEDIGTRANLGFPGTRGMWEHFLPSLLNVQSTDLLTGQEFLLLGHFNIEDLLEESDHLDVASTDDLEQMRKLTEALDNRVKPIIEMICEAGKVPVVIGGGHNNAYPIISGSAIGLQRHHDLKQAKLNVINLDAHADFRRAEGRHSGNGFRYAYEEGRIAQYSACLIHENYNGQEMMEALAEAKEHVRVSFFEQELLRKAKPFTEILNESIAFLDDKPTGIELDMDAIAGMPSSAQTPSGVSPEQARIYVTHAAKNLHPAYLHIAEGIPDEAGFAAKLMAYLVTDFAKEYLRYR